MGSNVDGCSDGVTVRSNVGRREPDCRRVSGLDTTREGCIDSGTDAWLDGVNERYVLGCVDSSSDGATEGSSVGRRKLVCAGVGSIDGCGPDRKPVLNEGLTEEDIDGSSDGATVGSTVGRREPDCRPVS